MVIRSFTPAVAGIYNLIPSDRGRPLTDIASQIDYGDLRPMSAACWTRWNCSSGGSRGRTAARIT